MSGGAGAQSGFVYQNDYAALQILGSEAKRILAPDDSDGCISSFTVEGPNVLDGPVWDVAWTLKCGDIHVRECKDTAITRSDRERFYRHVRSEVAKGIDAAKLNIGWVTDPTKQDGHILEHLARMGQIDPSDIDGSDHSRPHEVDSPLAAIREGLFLLTHEDGS